MADRTRSVQGTRTAWAPSSSTDDALRYSATEPSGRWERIQRPSTLTGLASGGAPLAEIDPDRIPASPALPEATRQGRRPLGAGPDEVPRQRRPGAVGDVRVTGLARAVVGVAPRQPGHEAEQQDERAAAGTAP